MNTTKLNRVSAIALFAALVLAGCGYNTPLEPSGDLYLFLNQISAQSLNPTADMNITSYRILGQGPQSETFDETTGLSSILLPNLSIGEWLITVDAQNSLAETVGRGTQTVQIHTAITTSAVIRIAPLDGPGTLQLSLSWPSADVESPSVSATLTPGSGDSIILPFSLGGDGTATYQGTFPSGYYTLSVLLEDNGVVVAGATETIRIVEGFETTGSIAFTDINAPGGAVEIGIIWEMNDPIVVQISGAVTEIAATESVLLTAEAPAESDPISFTWYLNGVSAGTGSTFTLNGSTGVGFYRIDVVAFTSDGMRSGSATATCQVVSP